MRAGSDQQESSECMTLRFILASGSPRRFEILTNLGLTFSVVSPDADESSDIKDPGELTEELALRKGRAVDVPDGDCVIISCDTVVHIDGEILGKPADEAEARAMLRRLSGRTHEVVSGICIIYNGEAHTAHELTRVTFAEMSDADIDTCVRLGSPCDKAGAYAVQGIASLWISGLDGDYFNVVGLPVKLLRDTLKNSCGIDLTAYLH